MQMVKLTAKIADLLIQKIREIREICGSKSIKYAGGWEQKSIFSKFF